VTQRESIVVHKFGGTSVGDADGFARVAQILGECRRAGRQPVVVVSAMAGVTDALIRGARWAAEGDMSSPAGILSDLRGRHASVAEAQLGAKAAAAFAEEAAERLGTLQRTYESLSVLGELTPRGRDGVMGFGEKLSACLLAEVLRAGGHRAEALNAEDLIVTDERFGGASVRMESTRERIRSCVGSRLEAGILPVITGYIAATEAGIPTTLGRSGSDRSAAIVAACLGADEVRIWTDVDGILTADPQHVPGARTLEELSYDEAAALARFGAEVLHPRTIRPVIAEGIPLRILNSFRPDQPGTRIVAEPGSGRDVSPAIISADGMCLLAIGNGIESERLATASRTLRRLAEAGIDVRMFSQSLADSGLGIVIRAQDREAVCVLLRTEPGGEDPIRREEAVATLSVIGSTGDDDRGIASRAFAALGRHAVRIIAVTQAVDGSSVSFCIPANRIGDSVRFLHRELGLDTAEAERGGAR